MNGTALRPSPKVQVLTLSRVPIRSPRYRTLRGEPDAAEVHLQETRHPVKSRWGIEPVLKKRDRFNDSNAQYIAELFHPELHVDEGGLNGAGKAI